MGIKFPYFTVLDTDEIMPSRCWEAVLCTIPPHEGHERVGLMLTSAIDLIIQDGHTLNPVEVTTSVTVRKDAVKNCACLEDLSGYE